MTSKIRKLVAGTLVALAGAATGAQAQMVVNGGFETGDFSGWSETGAIGSVYGVDSAGPRNENYSAFFGSSTPSASIWQTLATTAGLPYRVSFYSDRSAATTAGTFSASLGGVQFYADPGFTFPFAEIVVEVTAPSDDAVLMFSADNPTDFYTLDSVSVAVVPEPASALLWLVGLAAGLAVRRRNPVV